MPAPPKKITRLLQDARDDSAARDELLTLVYHDLHRIASGLLRRESRPGQLDATALVHEAFIRLETSDVLGRVPNHRCLFAAAAQAMRRVLIDHARECRAAKRGAGCAQVPLDAVLARLGHEKHDAMDLDEALDELAASNERQWLGLVLRFFGDFTVEEVARTLETSVSTVESDYRLAREWLRRRLGGDPPGA
jgi:RNA polymerase sigma factor (TIGR02999 family)